MTRLLARGRTLARIVAELGLQFHQIGEAGESTIGPAQSGNGSSHGATVSQVAGQFAELLFGCVGHFNPFAGIVDPQAIARNCDEGPPKPRNPPI